MRSSFIAFASVLCVGSISLAQAASPSADQIINSLKPTGTLSGGTRGIRPVAPSAPAPAAAPATPAAAHVTSPAPATVAPTQVAATKAPSINLNVQFQSGSAALTPEAMHTLDQLGAALTSATLASYRFRIEGHTDTVGTPDTNKSLSDQRAAAVAAYLESKFSVTAARLETVGLGESDPVVKTPPQTPEARNRRVQVINLGA